MLIPDCSTPVVVLRVHHGSLGIARSLGRLGVPVHAVHSGPGCPELRSRYWSSQSLWEFNRDEPDQSVAWLLELGERLGRRAVLVPTADDLAELVAGHAQALGERFLFQDNPLDLVQTLSAKQAFYHLAKRLGCPTAETWFPTSLEDVRRFSETASFPILLKASDGLRLEARTGRRMVIVDRPEELLAWYQRLEDPARPGLMLQEYIPGRDADKMWLFDGCFDVNSDCLMGITARKLRSHPVHAGATSMGVCERNERLYDQSLQFMKAVGYRGIVGMDYCWDARDGSYKLLDPNPRIAANFRLFVGSNGLDVIRCLYLHLTGQPVPETEAVEGRKWIVEDQDFDSFRDYHSEGSLSLGGWLRSLVGVREGAWFAWDDLGPAFGIAMALARRASRRLMKIVGLHR
jgi:D-aspartate ligase